MSFSHPVLANLSEIARISRSYGSEKYYIIFFSVLTAFALLWIVMYLLDLRKKPTTQKSTKATIPLFIQLCQTHELSSAQVTLLETMTHRAGLQPPETIFIDPSLWTHCIDESKQSREPLLKIMQSLFGLERVEGWFPDYTSEPDG